MEIVKIAAENIITTMQEKERMQSDVAVVRVNESKGTIDIVGFMVEV